MTGLKERKIDGRQEESPDEDVAEGDTLLSKYLKSIAEYPLLSEEEERKLLIEIAESKKKLSEGPKEMKKDAGKETAYRNASADYEKKVNQLAEHNLRLVVSIAKQYRGRGMEFLDLIQEGYFGLRKAITRFDATNDNGLATYAYKWIRFYISAALVDRGQTIRLPSKKVRRLDGMAKFSNQYLKENGREPHPEEIANRFNVGIKDVERMLVYEKHREGDLSLDTSPAGNTNLALYNIIMDESASADPLQSIIAHEAAGNARELLNQLNPKELKVINARFGIDATCDEEDDGKTLQAIGEEMKLTRQRIMKIESGAIEKMRKRCGRRS